MPEEPLAIRPSDEYGVLVPCSPEHFVDFISQLLGKPQVAVGEFRGPFNIELADIQNFYHLIDQRITEQNKGRLVEFSANIHYNDGTSVEVNTLQGLEEYAEVRPLVSTGVTLTWVYLVMFSTQTVPEKQQIEVNFQTSRPRPWHVDSLCDWNEENTIGYRVAYTARTWGADIENLLKDHISSLIIPERSSLKRFVRKAKTFVSGFIELGFYAIFLRIGIYVVTITGKDQLIKYQQLSTDGINQVELISRKLDFLFSTISGVKFASTVAILLVYLGGTLMLSHLAASLITDRISPERPSFVLLTRRAIHDKEEVLREYERNWQTFFGTFLITVVAGVIGNIATWFVWG